MQAGLVHRKFRDKVGPGDVVVRVTQKRSAIGAKPKAIGTLRALGLRGRDSWNVQPDGATTWGMVRAVRHLVEAARVVCTTEGFEEIAEAGHQERAMSTVSYDLRPGQGVELRSGSGPVAWIETHDSTVGLSWIAASSFGPRSILDVVQQAFGVPGESGVARVHSAGKVWEAKSKQLTDTVEADVEVISVSVGDDLEMIWQRSLVRTGRVEVSLLGPPSSVKMMLSVVSETGDREVQGIVNDISKVVQELVTST